MPTYANGYIPLDLLTVFDRGYNTTDGNWYHALSAATYARHLALVALAHKRTGRTLAITRGWSAYRPYAAQELAKRLWGNGAATPGTSSHGGTFEGKQTLAMDYGNWKDVYGGDTRATRAAFYADQTAVGLWPGAISIARGYPDEPWHSVDRDPWGAVPAFDGSTPFTIPEATPTGDDDMRSIHSPGRGLGALVGGAGGPFLYRSVTEAQQGDKLAGPANVLNGNDAEFDFWISLGNNIAGPNVATIAKEVWWKSFVTRGDAKVETIQELADAKTNTIALVARAASIDYAKLAAEIVKAGGTAPSADAIAKAVRAEFASDPLK